MQLVTSLGKEGFHRYGRKMLSSLNETCKLPVSVYTEDEITLAEFPKAHLKRLQNVKGWQSFQTHTSAFNPTSYLFDARRFSHKAYAMLDALDGRHRYVVWLDGDIVVTKQFGQKFIKSLIDGRMCAYLGRQGSYTETGFLAFDTKHQDFPEYEKRYRSMYDDKMIFLEPFWTDCHAFDAARQGLDCNNISPNGKGVEEVFPQSPLAEYMVHNKGARK